MEPPAPHPIGIKYWTNIWRANKDLPYAEIHTNYQRTFQYFFHRKFGRYYYVHRAGTLGTLAPIAVGFLGFKALLMVYGIGRDRDAAIQAAAAYGQGGYKCNPIPK